MKLNEHTPAIVFVVLIHAIKISLFVFVLLMHRHHEEHPEHEHYEKKWYMILKKEKPLT